MLGRKTAREFLPRASSAILQNRSSLQSSLSQSRASPVARQKPDLNRSCQPRSQLQKERAVFQESLIIPPQAYSQFNQEYFKMSPIKLAAILASAALAFAAGTTCNQAAQSASPQTAPGSQPAQPTNQQAAPSPPPPKVIAIVDGHLEADDLFKVEVEHLDQWAAIPGNN